MLSTYNLMGFWATCVRFELGPRLAGATVLYLPAAKSGIAGERGGVYAVNQSWLILSVGRLHPEISIAYELLLSLW
jgi:hypothetical protein